MEDKSYNEVWTQINSNLVAVTVDREACSKHISAIREELGQSGTSTSAEAERLRLLEADLARCQDRMKTTDNHIAQIMKVYPKALKSDEHATKPRKPVRTPEAFVRRYIIRMVLFIAIVGTIFLTFWYYIWLLQASLASAQVDLANCHNISKVCQYDVGHARDRLEILVDALERTAESVQIKGQEVTQEVRNILEESHAEFDFNMTANIPTITPTMIANVSSVVDISA